MLVVVALALVQNLLASATTTDFRLADQYESERAAALLEERLRGASGLRPFRFFSKVAETHEDLGRRLQ